MSENTEIAVAPGSEHRDQRTLSSFASSSHFCHFSFPFIHPPTSPLSLDGNVLSLHWEREQLCQRVQFIYRHLHPGSCRLLVRFSSLLRLCSCVHPGVSTSFSSLFSPHSLFLISCIPCSLLRMQLSWHALTLYPIKMNRPQNPLWELIFQLNVGRQLLYLHPRHHQ